MTADTNEKRDLLIEPLSPHRKTGTHTIHYIARPSDLDPICYREGELGPLGFDPVVLEPVAVSSMTISVTSLLAGSINSTRSGSFTKSRFFASGT